MALLHFKFERVGGRNPQGKNLVVQCITVKKNYNKYSPGLEGENLGQQLESCTLLSQDSF